MMLRLRGEASPLPVGDDARRRAITRNTDAARYVDVAASAAAIE